MKIQDLDTEFYKIKNIYLVYHIRVPIYIYKYICDDSSLYTHLVYGIYIYFK